MKIEFRLGQMIVFQYPHGPKARGIVVGVNQRLDCVKIKWTRNSGPGDWIPTKYLVTEEVDSGKLA